MILYNIPENSVEIQQGLWAHEYHYTFNKQPRMCYHLYAADGYCFWEKNQPENYNDLGELLPMEKRVFARQAKTACRTIDQLNENYFSVPLREEYEIV